MTYVFVTVVGKEREPDVCVAGRWVLTRVEAPRGRGGGSSGISSDGVDRRIFLGLKFSIPGFSWVGKFGKYFFFEGKKNYFDFSGRFELSLPRVKCVKEIQGKSILVRVFKNSAWF